MQPDDTTNPSGAPVSDPTGDAPAVDPNAPVAPTGDAPAVDPNAPVGGETPPAAPATDPNAPAGGTGAV